MTTPSVEQVPFWWHSITLPDGTVTPGFKPAEDLEQEWSRLRLEDLAGKSVLDIGAWDGFFSFRSERAGARRVASLDSFCWEINFSEYVSLMHRRAAGERLSIEHILDTCSGNTTTLPGRKGYETCHAALKSQAEMIHTDYASDDLDHIGQFDVVLFLGVLYHMEDPMSALRKLHKLTREVALIETEAVILRDPGLEQLPMWQYIGASKYNDDPTNFWTPNQAGLRDALMRAGFSRIEHLYTSEEPNPDLPVQHCRLFMKAWQ